MALTINTNVASLNAQRNLNKSQGALGTAMQRLSSGLRINSAKDDAAGLAISNRMNAQVRGINQAVRNANDGISLAQTAEGALGETTNILLRMRELAVQGGNETLSADDVAAIETEMVALSDELDRISTDTKFNGTALLDGTFTAKKLQVGANSGDATIQIDIASNYNASTLVVEDLKVTDNATAQASIASIDAAMKTVDTERADLGAVQNRLESTISNLSNVAENTTAAMSRIMDADIAQETSTMTKNNILQQAGVAILAQANQAPNLALSLLQ